MTSRRGALATVAAVRIGVGAALLARPQLLPKALGADSLTAQRVEWLGRMIGVRDLVLGLGGLRAIARGRDVRDWVHAQATCDAADAMAIGYAVLRRQAGPASGGALAGLAAASAVLQVQALAAARGD